MTVVSVEKDLERRTLTMVVEFDHPVERVWQLWADPRQLERWWGPPGYPSTFERHDLTEGCANPDGTRNSELPNSEVRVRLAGRDAGGTRMELRFTFESSEHIELLQRWGAFDVFPQSLAQMDDVLAS